RGSARGSRDRGGRSVPAWVNRAVTPWGGGPTGSLEGGAALGVIIPPPSHVGSFTGLAGGFGAGTGLNSRTMFPLATSQSFRLRAELAVSPRFWSGVPTTPESGGCTFCGWVCTWALIVLVAAALGRSQMRSWPSWQPVASWFPVSSNATQSTRFGC